jgi:hypothetical protein
MSVSVEKGECTTELTESTETKKRSLGNKCNRVR